MTLTTDSASNAMFKRAKLSNENTRSDKVIGTHSGTFQADEAMGVFLLRQTELYRNSRVIRTRDAAVYDSQCDIVLDVGGVYNHEARRYDHHQRGYDERFQNQTDRCTKLSASGLIYRHYGQEIIATIYPQLSQDYIDLAYTKLYDKLLQALDAVDTGEEMAPPGVTLRYKDATGLSSRVARLNPRWNEVSELDTGKEIHPDDRFEMAVDLCGQDFISVLTALVESELPARSLVEQALVARHETHASGEILLFSSGGMPWKSHLYELEKQHGLDDANDTKLVKFVLYQDAASMWRVQAVTLEGTAFENRLSLPEAWRGLRDADLVQATGGAGIAHAAGFIGGADSYEAALQMAITTLALRDEV
jgi:uncharacterized UPF0160 family protein